MYNQVEINTSQNVQLSFQLADLGNRILATLIDNLIYVLYIIGISFIIGNIFTTFSESVWTGFIILLPVILYPLFMESLFNGQTIGKMIMRIRVVKENGEACYFINYVGRWLLSPIESLVMLSGFIPLMSYLLTKNHQRLGDLVGKTIVINVKDNKKLYKNFGNSNLKEEKEVVFESVINLNKKDILLIQKTLDYIKLENYSEESLRVGNRLQQQLFQKLEISSKLETADFFSQLIDDYNITHGILR